MADYMSAGIEIGGKMTREGAEALAEVMVDEGLDYGASILFAMLRGDDPRQVEDLSYGWLDHGVLHAASDSVPWGEFDCVEAKCRELGLTYVRRSEGRYDISPEVVWSAGGDAPREALTDHVGNHMVQAGDVARVMAEAESKGIGDTMHELKLLREGLAAILPVIPVVPPLEIVEGEPS
jgi:hypothetical protein